jgi:glycosyltransferase involved in cell wall biosynthesis
MHNIAIVCGGGILSGKEVMVLQLAEGLRSIGYNLKIVTSFWSDGNFQRRLKALGLPANPVWFGFISATLRADCLYMTAAQILRWPQLLIGYRRFLLRFAPDKVIHTNWHSLLMIAPFLKRKRDVFWVHEVMPNKRQYRILFRWLERHLCCFIAVSHAVAESLRKLGIAEQKIHVIYNGIADPNAIGAEISRPDTGFVVGIVGQIGAWKGHEDLLEGFAQLASISPEAQLHIFGRGTSEYENVLRQKAATLGITDRLFWHGFILERGDIYREMDVCVIPSRFEEPLGMVAIEAGFFSMPVIATRRGGLPEIIQDGQNGFLIDPNCPNELASKLKSLLNNRALRNEMGARARADALERFNRERFIKDFVELLGAG